MSKIKVVHIVEALGGGVYTYFKNLSHFFGSEDIAKKVETTIIYSSKRKEIIPENIRKEFSPNVRLIEMDMVRELSPIKDFQSILALRKLLKELRPDLVHLHSSKAGILGRFANTLLLTNKKKVFYTPHGYAFLRQDISVSKRKFYHFIEKYAQRFFGGTTVACGDTEYEIAKNFGKSRLVRNGIDFKAIEKKYVFIKNEKLTFGIVGRITAQKNPKLFNEIAKRYPEFNFIWIGDGELRHEITAQNIQISGWFYDMNEVYSWVNKIDVFLQTSLWEGLPLAVLEAMALRKPVVAKNVIGNKDIVQKGKNGFLFDSVNELEPIFREIEQQHLAMGNNSFALCAENFDCFKNLKGLISIYQNALK